MNKNLIRKVIAFVLIALAIVLLFSTIFKSDKRALLGKWELADGESGGPGGLEFYEDNTGLRYDILSYGDTFDEEAFTYRLDGKKLSMDFGWRARVYDYEFSGGDLLLSDVRYNKTGSLGIPWFRYILIIVCLAIGIIVLRIDRKKFGSGLLDVSTKVCPSCNNLIGAREKFCPNCGHNMEIKAEVVPKASCYCPTCGSPASEGDVFCQNCGSAISAAGIPSQSVISVTPVSTEKAVTPEPTVEVASDGESRLKTTFRPSGESTDGTSAYGSLSPASDNENFNQAGDL